ncbi:hypothetical protein HMI54_010347 [Coelomomyces lativittatus]|nr:hypothetical protein HMI56_003157 [Coelomomyces lativittatus]KAJ1514679.1 hypothetical protein HMI55_004459 [Coelomomyces lativittatus]KAJ1518716.1 hypothetical protein HMI54_010347 [Coelomomyces lativittatus]
MTLPVSIFFFFFLNSWTCFLQCYPPCCNASSGLFSRSSFLILFQEQVLTIPSSPPLFFNSFKKTKNLALKAFAANVKRKSVALHVFQRSMCFVIHIQAHLRVLLSFSRQ